MAFSPFARFRNFTLDNLKACLEIYPDMAKTMTWSEAGDEIETVTTGYKKTSYQQACQFGLEDRGGDIFRVQNYLFSFDDANLLKYLSFWIKTYYAPNPYVKSEEDEPILIYCSLAKEILASESLSIDFYEYFNRIIGGKSDDILLNAIKAYTKPICYKKENNRDLLFIEPSDKTKLEKEVEFIEFEFPIIEPKDKKTFFDRYTYSNFCKFHGISTELQTHELDTNNKIDFKKLENDRIEGGDNVLYYGVPGSGKSYAIDKECKETDMVERVVFHPDYTYSDFVGQILPRINDDGKLEYVFTPGPFTKIMEKAIKDPKHKYYLIIEEINRGNAPAIFGEIFQLLDRIDEEDKNADRNLKIGGSKYFITNYDIAKEIYKDIEYRITIPSNMYLRATMNTSDQNVFTLDTAFQRRWLMKQVENNIMGAGHATTKIEGSNITWGAFATYVNELVLISSNDMASSEDKRLGAYFVKSRELSVNVFPEKVLKYLWDDAFKLDKEVIFDDKYKSLEQLIIDFTSTSNGDKLKQVLRADVYAKMLEKVNNRSLEQNIDEVDQL